MPAAAEEFDSLEAEASFLDDRFLEDSPEPALPGTLGELIADLLQAAPPSAPTAERPQAPIAESPAAQSPPGFPNAVEPIESETIDPIAPDPIGQNLPQTQWFLGLDIGTTGISAVLLNRSSGQLHPIYWYQNPAGANPASATGEPRSEAAIDKQFRLPLAVSLSPNRQNQTPETDVPIRDFKPYLNWTVPYRLSPFSEQPSSAQPSSSEPILSWSETQPLPLITLRRSLQALLTPIAIDPAADSLMRCGAVDLEATNLTQIRRQLEGIIVSLPAGWSDAYRFNLREALLAAQVVDRPDQILFLEESIATLLAAFAGSAQSPLQMPQGQVQHEIQWQGNTLILCSGATQTELALINLPQGDAAIAADSIAYADFHIRSLTYAGAAIDQDIVSQLLYPLLPPADHPAQIDFPAVGEPDVAQREVFQQWLRGTATGRSLLQTARALKLNLQQQNRYAVQIGEQQTTFLRQDLTTKVLLPFVQRLNRELNALLSQTETPALNVRQVVCTGGTASLGAITRWLQQKLPNALILQDAYPWTRSLDCIPTCSRVAYGLAALPFYPLACDRASHRYSNFLLLQTLMRDFPARAVTLDEVLELLQAKGMDAAACRSRILAILEGLPVGLIPNASQIGLLAPLSQQNPDYQAIAAAPLFHAEQYPDGKAYRIDRAQLIPLRHYWEQVLQDAHQSLIEANQSLEFGIHPV